MRLHGISALADRTAASSKRVEWQEWAVGGGTRLYDESRCCATSEYALSPERWLVRLALMSANLAPMGIVRFGVMTEDDSNWAKETLGYTDQWLELGIPTFEVYQAQRQDWSEHGAGRNTEHYRYAAWRKFWSDRESISNELLRQCISLAISDADPAIGRAMLHDILKTSRLSDQQFQMVREEMSDPSEMKIVERYSLFRQLRTDQSLESLDRAVRHGDSIVQRHVIDNYRLSRPTLEFLEEKGAVRAVRNLARQHLLSRKSLE